MNLKKISSFVLLLFGILSLHSQSNQTKSGNKIKVDSTKALLSEPGVYYGALISKDIENNTHITIACANSPHTSRDILTVTNLIPSDWETFDATLSKATDGSLSYTADKTENGLKTMDTKELGTHSVYTTINISDIKKACALDSTPNELFKEIVVPKILQSPKIRVEAKFSEGNLNITILNKIMLDYKTVAQLYDNNGKRLSTSWKLYFNHPISYKH